MRESLHDISLAITLQIIWIGCAAIQLLFIVFFITQILRYAKQQPKGSQTINSTLSLVICAKNEARTVGSLLEKLPQQTHNQLEVILVNDGSNDGTAQLFDKWAQENPNSTVLHIPSNTEKDLPGKKYALRAGIEATTGDYILLTDADCVPASDDWAKLMHERVIERNAQVVLGYGAYEPNHHFLSTFVRFETLHTLIQYSAYAQAGFAYMGVGRNLLYQSKPLKEAFQNQEFLETLRQTQSGDDDLTVSYLAKRAHRFAIFPEEKAATISQPPKDFSQFLSQKQRHTSSAKYYGFTTKFLLGIYASSHFIFWFAAIPILFYSDFAPVISLIFGLVLVFKSCNLSLWRKTSSLSENLFLLLLCDFLWSIYNLILSPYIFFKNKKRWK